MRACAGCEAEGAPSHGIDDERGGSFLGLPFGRPSRPGEARSREAPPRPLPPRPLLSPAALPPLLPPLGSSREPDAAIDSAAEASLAWSKQEPTDVTRERDARDAAVRHSVMDDASCNGSRQERATMRALYAAPAAVLAAASLASIA